MDTTPPEQPIEPADYDSPWKEILERYFKEFMEFFFPVAYAGIDWSKNYEFLDKELQQIVRDAELGRRRVDKLVKVYTIEDEEAWVVVHVEVQGQQETDFAQRMYVYNYRLYDRYHKRVSTLAILADDRDHWRPCHFGYDLWGCRVNIEFPSIKLLDYVGREEELDTSRNLFAIVVVAYLKARATRKNPEERLQWKLRLVRMLSERGYAKQDVLELFRFIDWIMRLPEAFAERFDEIIFQYEKEHKMQYVTSIERHGIKKGREEGRQEGFLQQAREAVVENLQVRFEAVPEHLIATINMIDDLAFLKYLHRTAITVDSLDDFVELVTHPLTTS